MQSGRICSRVKLRDINLCGFPKYSIHRAVVKCDLVYFSVVVFIQMMKLLLDSPTSSSKVFRVVSLL